MTSGRSIEETGTTAAGRDPTLLEVLRLATTYLGSHGSTSARLDAELLLAHALGLRRLDLYLQHDRPLADRELAPYRDLVAQRGRGQPVAYLIGRREFMNLDFEVTPDVLVPHPDTEVLVEVAVSRARGRAGAVRVADVGTGSGCIAVSIAHYVPAACVWASDVNPAALAVAERNVQRHGLASRVALLLGDLLDPLPHELDLICANLPYVAEGDPVPQEVLNQPSRALYAPEGGAGLIRLLLAQAPGKLAPGGAVLAEIDPAFEEAFPLDAYAGHRLHRDLGGHVRVLEAWIS